MAGDAAVTVLFEPRIDPDVNRRAIHLAAAAERLDIAGVRDVVPTYSAVTVYFDPLRTDIEGLLDGLQTAAGAVLTSPVDAEDSGREIVVPVRYGGEEGPDLADVAGYAGCSEDEVIRRHTARRYRVYMLGFLPGFAYMGTVDSTIAMPRRETPRQAVAAGSVGIAGVQTGVYPLEAPGGWRLIGRTHLRPFDPDRDEPFLFRPGDVVRFEAARIPSPPDRLRPARGAQP